MTHVNDGDFLVVAGQNSIDVVLPTCDPGDILAVALYTIPSALLDRHLFGFPYDVYGDGSWYLYSNSGRHMSLMVKGDPCDGTEGGTTQTFTSLMAVQVSDTVAVYMAMSRSGMSRATLASCSNVQGTSTGADITLDERAGMIFAVRSHSNFPNDDQLWPDWTGLTANTTIFSGNGATEGPLGGTIAYPGCADATWGGVLVIPDSTPSHPNYEYYTLNGPIPPSPQSHSYVRRYFSTKHIPYDLRTGDRP